MTDKFDTFVLYYTCFHEGELNLKEFKDMLLADLGQEGLKEVINIFRNKRLEREKNNIKGTLYQQLKKEDHND